MDSSVEQQVWQRANQVCEYCRDEHFEWSGPWLIGKTPVGRATIDVLTINHHTYVRLRESLIAEGLFPPSV